MLSVQTSQGEVVIDLPDSYKNVGIKMSGGADSSIIAYMLFKLVKEQRPDITLHAITMNHPEKAFQVPFAKQVIEWLENHFGIKIGSHSVSLGTMYGDYSDDQEILMHQAYKLYDLDCHFLGVTCNPFDYQTHPTLVEKWKFRDIERDNSFSPTQKGLVSDGNAYQPTAKIVYLMPDNANQPVDSIRPFHSVDKKAVAEIYQHFRLMDTLFPLTRSCEKETTDFSQHCGKCWWCGEREYGFGRLQ